MSDLRIALIAEGPTDEIIIKSALKAILPKPFILTLLQPEPTRPDLGGGWGGVLKWCRKFRSRGFVNFEHDPTLGLYDLFILHLDADVAHFSYADISRDIEQESQQVGWGALPCCKECPPPETTIINLKPVLLSWLGIGVVGDRTVICIPSKSSETWLAVAAYPNNQALLNSLECVLNMETRLAQLPKGKRIKKCTREYRNYEATVKSKWDVVRRKCSRANTFHHEFGEAVQRLTS